MCTLWKLLVAMFLFMYFFGGPGILCHGRAQDIDHTVEFLAMILWAMACFVLRMLDPLNLSPKHPKTVGFCGLFVHRCQGLSKGGTGKGISNLNNYIQARWGPMGYHNNSHIFDSRIESNARPYGPVGGYNLCK